MTGWGINLTGLSAAQSAIRDVSFEFDDDAVYLCGPTVRYAVYVDQGTSRMEARPFARPAAQRVQADLSNKVGQFLGSGAGQGEVVKAAALAVEAEMKQIITEKGAVDTGAMRASVTIERMS